MKNKRWKRKAKSIVGECHNHIYEECKKCKYGYVYNECTNYIFNSDRLPYYGNIREIEKVCKGWK